MEIQLAQRPTLELVTAWTKVVGAVFVLDGRM
jgi:hypothetical protein